MEVSWKNVEIFVPNNKKNAKSKYAHLVQDSSGVARKGKVLAIMGPSGSGKTTLVKSLVGLIPSGSKTSGFILGDGEKRNAGNWIKKSCYVDQDDNIYENLTTYETVLYSAKFRCKNQKNCEKKIDKLFKKLRIDNIKHNKMNSISGGERKRVMIAVELVADSELIFLDEPTSGLDSYIAI